MSRRFNGLLPTGLLRWRRPIWWQEVAIVLIGYLLYSMGRNAVPQQESIARRHAQGVQNLQDALHLNFELSLNHYVAAHEWLAQVMDYYYATLHFVVTIGVMVWLFVRRPHVYRGARTVMFATSLFGLLGFYLYPLAPPRLLPQYDYVDTLLKFHTWGSLADPSIAAHSNQFAAMPSLHIAWALWCGIALLRCAHWMWVRVARRAVPRAHAARHRRHGQSLRDRCRRWCRHRRPRFRNAVVAVRPGGIHAAVRRARLRAA